MRMAIDIQFHVTSNVRVFPSETVIARETAAREGGGREDTVREDTVEHSIQEERKSGGRLG